MRNFFYISAKSPRGHAFSGIYRSRHTTTAGVRAEFKKGGNTVTSCKIKTLNLYTN